MQVALLEILFENEIMGQTQDKDPTNNSNSNISTRDNKKKKKKGKLKKDIPFKIVEGTLGVNEHFGEAIYTPFDAQKWKKIPLHVDHFELSENTKSSINSGPSLGLFYCLPNEILSQVADYLSWKEALILQACSR